MPRLPSGLSRTLFAFLGQPFPKQLYTPNPKKVALGIGNCLYSPKHLNLTVTFLSDFVIVLINW